MRLTLEAVKTMNTGFICTNVQETDLAGHSQDSSEYKRILERARSSLAQILPWLNEEDILIVQADHGNDPKDRKQPGIPGECSVIGLPQRPQRRQARNPAARCPTTARPSLRLLRRGSSENGTSLSQVAEGARLPSAKTDKIIGFDERIANPVRFFDFPDQRNWK